MLLRLVVSVALAAAAASAPPQPAAIAIDYPERGSILPPEITPPAFLWRDPVEGVAVWRIEIKFAGGAPVRAQSRGERLPIGEIDPRAVAETNQPPKWNPQIAAARSWTPGAEVWETIKKHSVKRPATVTITGYREENSKQAVSRGEITIQTSKDPVGAPIFYRDVPLMPSETEKGVIKPLAAAAVPLIGWRLRDVGEAKSRLLLEGLHTCANCHSFSRDGKTLGMDLDGPRNDKGMYAIVSLAPQTTIRNQDVVNWGSFRGTLGADLRVGFMSQVSPDGRHVVTMIDRPDAAPAERARAGRGHFYVANFKDYRFLQVFYPTRGILAWYSRATGRLQPLPGADDPRYVHTNAVWAPDGQHLVFARADAKQPYPEGRKLAEFANDPNETPIQYDLYRIPFNDGRGGRAEPIAGASGNGMSNTFPKVSPDGRWIVFVQCRNAQLMRPDSRLYIVPVNGGAARPMRCNLPVMNSWHSFSPNGRWLVFSSKSRSPYTQMYLTHIDEKGQDSPAILVDNATAANRAVNIPEFVNIPPGGLAKIDVPAVDYYRMFDQALDLARKGQYEVAVTEWKKALELGPDDASAHMNLGVALAGSGKLDEAIAQYRKALDLSPGNPESHLNFGIALAGKGDLNQAIAHYQKALEINPEYPEVHNNLGVALAAAGKLDDAIVHYQKALGVNPDYPEVHNNLGVALARTGKLEEAISHFRRALAANPNSAEVHGNLGRALAKAGQADVAITHFEKALALNPGSAEIHNTLGVMLVGKRRLDEAIAHFERALEVNPRYVEARQNLGDTLYYLRGKTPEALAQWREALRAAPNHVIVLNQTARVLATSPEASLRNGAEAVALAERAVQLTGAREPEILDTLAAALAEAGRFPEAVETARRALALAGERNDRPLVEAVKARIALYEAKTPLRRAQ
ncbi:MAG: tetratricopeptide repeat protein [Bryobacterales bacterium]|nr:tetratricopeptide repeat protein [Bryobacterales bacterium]